MRVWLGLVILNLTVKAAPIGFYIRPTVMAYSREDKVFALHLCNQFNQGRLMELVCTFDLSCIEGPVQITFIDKHTFPFNHDYNVYTEWGFSLPLSIDAGKPFIGIGLIYYINTKWHVNMSWRYDKLLSFSIEDDVSSRKHSFSLGIGYYIG